MQQQAVAAIGASLDLGAGRRGVDMGPSAIRYAGLDARIRGLGRVYHDRGNVEGPVVEIIEQGSPDARYISDIVAVCGRVSDEVSASVAAPKAAVAPILASTIAERGRGAAKRGSSDCRSRSPAVTSMAMGIPPVNMAITRKKGMVASNMAARLAGVETSTTGVGAIDDLAAVVFVVELAFDGRADALQGILVKSALIPRKEGRMSSLGSERERVDSVD